MPAQGGRRGVRTEYQPPPDVQRQIDEIVASRSAQEAQPTLQPAAERDAEFVFVPRYNVEAGAGAGRVVERESEIGKLAFRRDWLAQKGVAVKNLAVIRVKGDSMAPTIRDGALVLVDTGQEKVTQDGIYVLMYEGELVAKRLQVDFAAGGVIIKSDNPAYDQQHVAKDAAENLYIIGRAIWAGGEV
ncbi:MAG: hypothetical protein A3F74_19570 [Betaproteobacteria bacterium RIFCSPLOWO2_12_FULL_62_58]|nr:MAG: hypothetical protein A3F74_19570 [Betaproteobacteria bacterium RIFCSPLOWO2_12_FULL_62_58]